MGESHRIPVPKNCENMHKYSASTTLQYLLTYVLVPFCAYIQLIFQPYSVYGRGMKVHLPLQFLASIIEAYTMTKLRKVLNSPPTKHYAHLVVKQHFLSRFVSSGMLLSSFPSQNSFTRTRRKLISTNRRGTVVRPSWECRGSVIGGFLIALPRRFCGWFLTIKRRFVETVVALSWRGSVVDASWMASWACCWSPCHDGFVDGF